MLDRSARRCLDLVVAGVALLLCSPVLIAASTLVRLDAGPPVIFRQRRVGMDGQEFDILKFRTMVTDSPDPMVLGQVTADTQYVTRAGRVLRTLKIDELPQLINVLRGDMSLVGPRPVLPEHREVFGEEPFVHRGAVRPGMTGLAQVSGNTALSWDERLELDFEYIDRQSFVLNLSILFRTIGVVMQGRAG